MSRLINADKLIELIDDDIASLDEDMPREGDSVCRCTLKMVKLYIKSLPTVETVTLEDYRSMEQTVYKLTQAIAEAEPRWIPTTERLPDVGVYVLVCTKQKSGQIIERIGVYSGTSYGWSTGGATRDVVAWMPLPKAYKGDEVKNG